MPAKLDITGERYGRLVAIEYVGRANYGKQMKSLWRFRCDCGQDFVTKIAFVRKGDTKSCGCYKRDVLENHVAPTRLAKGEASFNALYYRYVASAAIRGFEWGIDVDTFRFMSQQNCHYCGIAPSQDYWAQKNVYGGYVYNGIDRIDNAGGYTSENIVTCCAICNRGKHTMSQDNFIAWVSRVYRHYVE